MITRENELAAALAECTAAGVLALDTEFVWEKTYYPALGLIQFGCSPERVWLVDTLALESAAPLRQILENPEVVKILHDARQDLWILRHWCGARPKNVFDTRLAGGFCGLASTLSLQAVLRDLLGVTLEKSETRTNWLQRPLSDRQRAYALDDVRFLPELRSRFLEAAQVQGTRAWLGMELLAYDDPGLYDDPAPEDAWEKVKGAAGLDPAGLAVLRELAAWREQQARKRDLPRLWVLNDEALLGLVRVRPEEPAHLEAVQAMTPRQIQNYGRDLLVAVRHGMSVPRSSWPAPRERIPEAVKKEADAVLAMLKEESQRLRIDPALFGSRAEVTRLVVAGSQAQPEAHPLLRGWRREAVGQRLEALLPVRWW